MKTQAGDGSAADPAKTTPVLQVDVAALWHDYADKIEHGARRVLRGNDHDVADALQSVAEKLQKMHRRGALTPRQDWAAYLWRAGYYAAIDIVADQQAARAATVPLGQALDSGQADQFDPQTDQLDPVGDEVGERDAHRALWNAVDRLRLDRQRRRIVTGAWLDGMTDAELGRELGISGQRVGVLRRDLQTKLARLVQGGEQQ